MEGGIHAWEGVVAEGAPQSGMAYFSPATKPEELIALAWYLEDGSRKFYSGVAASLLENEARDLYMQLAKAEEHHKASLLKLYKEYPGGVPDTEFPESVLPRGEEGDVMEGGMRVTEALQWAKGKKVTEILELSLSLEANAYDLYLKMERQMKDQRSAHVFLVLSGEEKQHLEQLGSFLERRI